MTNQPPRRPGRPAGPRGKIRIAGSGPAKGKLTGPEDESPEAAGAQTPDAQTPDAQTPAADVEAPESSRSGAEATDDATAAVADPASTDADDTVSLDKADRRTRPVAKSASLKKPARADGGVDGSAKRPTAQGATAAPARSGFLTWRKVAAVASVAVLFAVLAIVLAFKPGAKTESNDAFLDAAATSELKAQAGDRMCTVLGVDPVNFDDWAARAKAALTGEYINEFNEYLQANRDLATQTGQGAECKVDLIGISNMDDTRANVIGTFVLSNTQQGVAVLGTPNLARVDVGLEKVDGQWLISRISDF
ncbi:Mce-associated membrane protein [Williamsia limnetica]|uniref:Mce-associated membrane protein n=1 Tax=Williamsia limnetica TaxID=882452 RepID=A0A318RV43_WILLI|nr:hypothetical protein [Williamsia limnetica]PYE20279.1 Mce-associated membrane protein [Williamsia limnetica]